MNQDHIFVDIKFASDKVDGFAGKISEMALVRTDKKGKVLQAYDTGVITNLKDSVSDIRRMILDKYDDRYVVIAHNVEVQRAALRKAMNDSEFFGTRAWVDLAHMTWPLAFCDMVKSRSLKSLADYCGIPANTDGSAAEDCTVLIKVYTEIMKRYRTALIGEEAVRDFGGQTVASIRDLFGI